MVDYSVSYYRADRYKLWVPLQRPGVRPTRNYASGYRQQ
jgi:GntR family transcriptional regulator